MEEILVIDRFEENIAVCENRANGQIKEIHIVYLPEEAREGTVLKYEDGRYVVDKQMQEEISNRIKRKMDDIWNN